jgi:hypothetical protein
MKNYIIIIAFFFCGKATIGQGVYTPVNPTPYGSNNNRIKSIYALGIPSKDTTVNTYDTSAQIFYRPADSSIWAWSVSRGFFRIGAGAQLGDIDVLQNIIDSSSFGIKKLDGTVKNVVIYADGLTGVSGTGIQSIQAGTNVTVDNTDPLNPVVSATGSGSSSRFGIEDNTGVQDRTIDMQQYSLQLDSINNFHVYSNNDGGYLDFAFGDGYNYTNRTTEIYADNRNINLFAQGANGGERSTYLNVDSNHIGIKKVGPGQDGIEHNIPVSVNGNYADSTGNITISAGGGGTYTASGGLTMVGSDIHLGGTLTPGAGKIQTGYDYIGLNGQGSIGVLQVATTSETGSAIRAFASVASLNTITPIIYIEKSVSGVPSNGFGASIDMFLQSTGSPSLANRIISKWTDVNVSTRTSEFSIVGVNSAITKTLLQISGAGVFTLTQGLANYADNAAAIAGGLTVGQLYRNGDIVQIVH